MNNIEKIFSLVKYEMEDRTCREMVKEYLESRGAEYELIKDEIAYEPIIEYFEKHHNIHKAEYDTWQEAIEFYFKHFCEFDPFKKRKVYKVDMNVTGVYSVRVFADNEKEAADIAEEKWLNEDFSPLFNVAFTENPSCEQE